MPEPKPTYTSDFAVEEVNGTRSLILSGRALPHRTLDLGGENNINKEHHQGNPVATIQILNPTEDPTTVSGRWKAEFMDGGRGEIEIIRSTGGMVASTLVADDPNVAIVKICEALDEIRATAPLVDVTWMNSTHRGVFVGFRYKISDAMDVAWEMTFEWEAYKTKNRDSERTLVVFPERLMADWASRLESAAFFFNAMFGFDPVAGSLAGYQVPVVSDAFKTMATITDQLKRFNSALGSIKKMQATLFKALLTPAQLAQSFLSSLLEIKDTLIGMGDFFKASSYSEYSAVGTAFGAAIPGFAAGAGFEIQSSKFEAKERLLDLRYAVEVDVRRLKKEVGVQGQIRDIVIAKEGQHLGSIAKHYFGTFSSWPKLALYNGIENPVLVGGRLVTIPNRL